MNSKKKPLLKKYQVGTGWGGGLSSGTITTWQPSPTSPTANNPSFADPGKYNNASVIPEGSMLEGKDLSGGGDMSEGMSGSIGSGIAAGLGAVATGLDAGTASIRANTRSTIDPRSIYAYNSDKSIWATQQKRAGDTAAGLDAAGDVLNSIPLGFTQIIGAGLKVGAAGTRMGQADLTKRDIEGHNEIYKEKRNIGGYRGNFTNQGQFTTYDDQESRPVRAKMGGYLDQYKGGGLYANIHAKRARIKAGSGETMRSPGDEGAPTAKAFIDSAKTAKMGMGGMLEYGEGGYTVTRSNDRKGKTHKVTGPDGSVKYFGDPGMGERSESKYGKEAFYARHKKNLEGNPHFRAYARATWKDGGIYIDPEKRGTFKAQATKMDMGVQEAASKILSAPEGEYSPEMRKKANFAKNFAKENGGYLKQYMGGGMAISTGVPRQYANAELEGGEIVEKQMGPDVYVKGPSHEKGGVPMMLQEGGPAEGGDYVWSDHLTYKGKTMAEWYEMAVNNGASEQEIDQLRMLQEQLAGRAGEPQDAKELQEIPAAKNGGMLKKYQTGTPYNTTGPLAEEIKDDDYVVPRPLMETDYSVRYNTSLKGTEFPTYYNTTPKEEIGDYKLAPEDDVKESDKKEESKNLLSKTGTQPYGKRTAWDKTKDLIPYGAAGIGAVAQLAATLGAKNPYSEVSAPKAERVSTDKQFFERTDARTEMAQNERQATLSKQLLQQAGAGPSEIAALQKVDLERQAADATAVQRAREFNIQQDRAEKQLNTELKLRADMANQAVANEMAKLEYERKLNEAGFDTERTQAIGDIISGTMLDVGKFASDANYARAIEGGTGVGKRAWNYDPYKARVQIKADNPQKDGESNTDYELRINQLQNKYAAEFFKNS